MQRWYPEIDPDHNGVYDDSDYPLTSEGTPTTGDTSKGEPSLNGIYLNQEENNFNALIGDAFKFTFTLYDSRGVFPDGKTFTYIVYLN